MRLESNNPMSSPALRTAARALWPVLALGLLLIVGVLLLRVLGPRWEIALVLASAGVGVVTAYATTSDGARRRALSSSPAPLPAPSSVERGAPRSAPDALTTADWEWDLESGRIAFSDRCLEQMGVDRSRAHGELEDLLAHIHSLDRDAVLAGLADLAASQSGRFDGEYRMVRTGGALRWVALSAHALRDERGTVSAIVGVQSDITDRRDVVSADAGAGLLEGAMHSVGVGVAVLGSRGVLARVSPSLSELVSDWSSPDAWWEAARGALPEGAERDGQMVLGGTAIVELTSPAARERVFELTHSSEGATGGQSLVLVRDVTESFRFEASLKESEERYALAARAANDGLWDWNLETGAVYFAPRWRAMLGLDREDVDPTIDAWFGRVHPEDYPALGEAIEAHLRGESDHFSCEYRMLHRTGVYHWMQARGVAVRDASGEATRLAGSQTDITERRRAEEKLRHEALYDALTGLPNRVHFNEVLTKAVDRAQDDQLYTFAVLFLDLDRFKLVNDSLGHLAGDEMLVQFAERLKACLRLNDTVARLGGDEFTILLEDIETIAEAEVVARRIHSALRTPFHLSGQDVFTSTSIGITTSAFSYEHPQAVLRDADTAMYRAKAGGKDQFVVFDATMHARARSLLKLHTDLRHAIEREELELQYQPIVDLNSGSLAGFEALVRWRHHERGMVWPDEFIPVAEENGLIVPMGEWVLEEACRQLLEWQREIPAASNLTIAVNLSSHSVTSPDIVDDVRRVLERTGLPPRCLKLEVTESAVMENAHEVAVILERLKQIGVSIYVDDFGTGYSSLAYLHRFDVDALKIDRSFVSKMNSAEGPSEIVGAITALAKGLDLSIVAEGIQTQTQLRALRGLGCQYGQGYLFARPLDPEYARSMILEDPVWR